MSSAVSKNAAFADLAASDEAWMIGLLQKLQIACCALDGGSESTQVPDLIVRRCSRAATGCM